MLGHIFRLVKGFEQEHGVHPNLLYLNPIHTEHLQLAFEEGYSLAHIMEFLNMEMILDPDIMHPHVAWTQSSQRAAS